MIDRRSRAGRHTGYENNAANQCLFANLLEYTIIIASLLTAFFAVMYSTVEMDAQGHGDGGEAGAAACSPEDAMHLLSKLAVSAQAIFATGGEGGNAACPLQDAMYVLTWVVSALPILSTFLLSCNSRFSPLNKWRQLMAAAASIKSEIYLYRTRVGGYAPLAYDKSAQLALLSGEAQQRGSGNKSTGNKSARNSKEVETEASGGEADNKEVETEGKPGDDTRGAVARSRRALVEVETEGKLPGSDTPGAVARSRRALFAEALEDIQSTLMNGEIAKSALLPSGNVATSFEKYRKKNLHGNQTGWLVACCGCLKDAKVRPSVDNVFDRDRLALQDYADDESRDDGIEPLSAEEYIKFRLEPELKRYKELAPWLSFWVTVLQTITLFASAGNAWLAITKRLEYVPLLVALTGAVSAVMEYEMLNVRLLACNNAQMVLGKLLIWWQSLSLIDRRTADSKRYLVESTEEALHTARGWYRSNRRKPAGSTTSQEKSENAGKEKVEPKK